MKFSKPNSEIIVELVLNEKHMKKIESPKKQNRRKFTFGDNKSEPPETGNCYINFDLIITDFGCGIPENKLESLFINFSKIAENSGQNINGVGLGLSICKNLIEQMAGSVAVESKVGKGTIFNITFLTECKIDVPFGSKE